MLSLPLIAALLGPAHAQDEAGVQPMVASEGVAPSRDEVDRPDQAQQRDAAATHGLITPRAQTLEQGQTTIHVQDLLLVGLSYGLTDDLQVTVQGLAPVTPEVPRLGLIRGKVVLARTTRSVLSGRVDIGVAWPGGETGAGASYGLGATVDWHADDQDRLLVQTGFSAHAGAAGALDSAFDLTDSAVLLYEGGLRWRIRGPVHLMGELWVPITWQRGEVRAAPTLVAPVGLRLATSLISLDAGLVLGRAESVSTGDTPFGLPWVAGTLRFR